MNNDAEETVTYKSCEIVGSTDKAVRVRFTAAPGVVAGNMDFFREVTGIKSVFEHWIPQSVIHDDSEIWRHGDKGSLTLKVWWARKQGWC